MICKRSIVVIAVFALFAMVLAGPCEVSSDCPGYAQDSFCNSIECNLETAECVEYPNPCPGACVEAEKRCVECVSSDDCPTTNLCNIDTNTCAKCGADNDCARTDWCNGDHEQCEASTGKCVPGPSPCDDPLTCIPSARQCFACTADVDCGTYDFCTNPVVCDRPTGICLVHSAPCKAGEICDSENKKCVQCKTDNDCQGNSDTFCVPPQYCTSNGVCEASATHANPCQNDLAPNEFVLMQQCNEAKKMCVPVPCVTDAGCDDGNCANGKEECHQHQCVVTYVDCVSDGSETTDPDAVLPSGLLGSKCVIPEDCADEGYLCAIASATDSSDRTCSPCSTDAECSDGNPENGDEACNLETGQCQWPQVVDRQVAAATNQTANANTTIDSIGALGNMANVFGHDSLFPYISMDVPNSNATGVGALGLFGKATPMENAVIFIGALVGIIILVGVLAMVIYFCAQDKKKKSKSK